MNAPLSRTNINVQKKDNYEGSLKKNPICNGRFILDVLQGGITVKLDDKVGGCVKKGQNHDDVILEQVSKNDDEEHCFLK